MKTQTKSSFSSAPPDVCTILVLYDDDQTRAQAMRACDFLVNQFWQDLELDFNWWRTDFLADAALAEVASKTASVADFLIISLRPGRVVEPELESWFESWIQKRGDIQGALVDLTNPGQGSHETPEIESFLQQVCRRGNFEFLRRVPGDENSNLSHDFLSPDAKNQIDCILGEIRPPTHYGLNE